MEPDSQIYFCAESELESLKKKARTRRLSKGNCKSTYQYIFEPKTIHQQDPIGTGSPSCPGVVLLLPHPSMQVTCKMVLFTRPDGCI
jgi:hypothetical protein